MKKFSVRLTGESHGDRVGAVVEGFPEGVRLDSDILYDLMRRRSTKNSFSSGRKECDGVIFESGITDGVTNGDTIELYIKNEDVKRSDYAPLAGIPRPSHADFAAYMKYGADFDMSGGGMFSGRLTAPMCAVGALCMSCLKEYGIEIFSRVKMLHGIYDDEIDTAGECGLLKIKEAAKKDFPTVSDTAGKKMKAEIENARKSGDSVGGIAECTVTGIKAGVGETHFQSFESVISKYVFAIPSVKGIEFGGGFASSSLFGSENNDAIILKDGRAIPETNRHGGVLGGISSGMPIVFRAAIKPVPSVSKKQRSVNLKTGEPCEIEITGRHDVTSVIRALPAIESSCAMALFEIFSL